MIPLHDPGHWRVRPEHDTRTFLAPWQRGQLSPGHTLTLPCAACARAASPVTVRPPPPPPAASALPRAERPTARVAGDRAVAPTLRAPPRPASTPAPDARPPRATGAPPAVLPALAARGWGSLADEVLLALASMPEGMVSLEALVLRAWARDPMQFGLRGHEHQHPDTRRVLATLEGPEGLVLRALVARPQPSMVRLTAAGRRAAAALARGGAR